MANNFTIERIGNWGLVVNLGRNFIRYGTSDSIDLINEQAEVLEGLIRETILSGKALGPKLAKSTIAKKGHGTKLVDTKEFGNAISVVSRTKNFEGFLGFEYNNIHSSGIDMAHLAYIHEEGNAHIPARPFFLPTLVKFLPKMYNNMWKKFKSRIKMKLK